MADGTTSPTSGTEHIQISDKGAGNLEITRNGREQFIATTDGNSYSGVTQLNLSGLKFVELIEINRYTGQLDIELRRDGGVGIKHTGTCKTASKKF